MKMTFRLYRRGKTYYAQNNDTGEQESLRTKDKATATRLLNAKNESTMLMGSNLLVARAYMVASDHPSDVVASLLPIFAESVPC